MNVPDRSPSWLSSLLDPVPVRDFLSTYWQRQHLVCTGPADRFATLLSWPEINEILRRHWREHYRFRLALRGRDLDPKLYADLDGFTPRIRPKDLTDYLRQGATLSFDAIDEVHEPLTALAESFEAFFRGATKINIYAGWRALHGLDLHRDNQEIFILQLDGRKHWALYGPSIEHVDRRELADSSVPPSGAALDRVLQPGEVLYIPRGCYHVAVPMNEPALHLTIGVKTPRGADLLTWIAARAGTSEIGRLDLPLLAPLAERIRYSEEIRRVLADGLADDAVEQYMTEAGSNLKPRPRFSLPSSATSDLLPSGLEFQIRLDPRARAASANGGREFALLCGGRRLRFPAGMRHVLEVLTPGSPVPMARVIEIGAARDEPAARLLVGMLVREHVAVVVP